MSEPHFYTVTYTYIESLKPTGKVSSLKDEGHSKFRSKRVKNSKIKKIKVQFMWPTFSKGHQKLTEAPKLDQSMHPQTGAQNVYVRPVFHKRAHLRPT